MRNSLLFTLLGLPVAMVAQSLTAEYIKWPDSKHLPDYISQWSAGTLNMEDENFFISRVKPHSRFRNIESQVNPGLNELNDKRLIYWVPVGDVTDDLRTNALPNALFNSEVFSMWSYVTHYGNWSSPHGWVPGGFADVAHKNGVAVSGLASIPYGKLSDEWYDALTAQINLSSDDVADFLFYHGVDGLAYNSEFYGLDETDIAHLQLQHADIIERLNNRGNPVAENIWYDGTNDYGSISFDQGLYDHNDGMMMTADGRKVASLFLNYNWNQGRLLDNTVYAADEFGIDPLDIYAGFNMQGGQPSSLNWTLVSRFNASIGLWGAHANNMMWLGKISNGSRPIEIQKTYQRRIEQWFSNGAINPAVNIPIFDKAKYSPDDDFFGMSAMMSARSSLCWNLNDEPFVSFFSLGNGNFFNLKGLCQHSDEWYDISTQDYLPTWRFWWANNWRGRNVDANSIGLSAEFTWDDAYFGGSSLRICGSDKLAYLHLFKTDFGISDGDKIRITTKLLSGSGKVSMILALKGSETSPIDDDNFVVLDANDADSNKWISHEFTLSDINPDDNLSIVGLKFEDSDNLNLLLGELSIVRPSANHQTAPATPIVTSSRVLANHSKGVDGKIIFSMPSDTDSGKPVYNLDVNTSIFYIYAQEEGGEVQFRSATTSWAAMLYSVPTSAPADSSRIRFGVSAVALDRSSQSPIAWSDWLEKGSYTPGDDIKISATELRTNTPFNVKYVDDNHSPSHWTIRSGDGNLIAEQNDANAITLEEGIDNPGMYTLILDEGSDQERSFPAFIQIADASRGSVPTIDSLTFYDNAIDSDQNIKIAINENTRLGYIALPSDGVTSRGLNLDQHWFGVSVDDLGLDAYSSFSVAGWIKLNSIPKGTSNFLTIEDRSAEWPINNWGFFWSRLSDKGTFSTNADNDAWGVRLHSSGTNNTLTENFDNTPICTDSWCHFAIVFEYNDDNYIATRLYLNGNLEHETPFTRTMFRIRPEQWIAFGGTASGITSVDGIIDDFQVWNKALTPDDVLSSMHGFDKNNLPANLLALWNFETDSDNDFLPALGSAAGAKAYLYTIKEGELEGQGSKLFISPSFTAGSPFAPADSYHVATQPAWNAPCGNITGVKGNDTAGQARISFASEGNYTVSVTLENDYGSDSRTFPIFTVDEFGTGIDDIAADNLQVYTVGSDILISIPTTADYLVTVANTSGRNVATRSFSADTGSTLRLHLPHPDIYILTIRSSQWTSPRSVKLLVH